MQNEEKGIPFLPVEPTPDNAPAPKAHQPVRFEAAKTHRPVKFEAPTPVAPSKTRGVFHLLIGVAAAVSILLLVWFGVTFFGGGEESNSNSSSLFPNIFGGTQTYVNEAWGFSVEYPEEWHILFARDRVLIASDQNWLEQRLDDDDPNVPLPTGAAVIQVGGEWLRAEQVPNLEAFLTSLMGFLTIDDDLELVTSPETVEINGHRGMRSQMIHRETDNYSDILLLGEGERSFMIIGGTSTTNEEVPEMAETLATILESFQIIEPAVESHQHPATGLSFVYPEDWKIEEGAGGLHMTQQESFSYNDGRFKFYIIGNASGIWPPSLNQTLVDQWINKGAEKIGENSIEIGTENEVYVQLLKAKAAHLEDDQVEPEELDTEIYVTSASFQGYEEVLGLLATCPVSRDSDACLETKMIMDSLYQLEPTEQSSNGTSTAAVEGQATAAVEEQATAVVEGQPTAAVEEEATAVVEGQPTPTLSPTPSTFTLEVVLIEEERLPNELTVTLLELNQTLEFRGGAERIDNLPLGRYTVRVSAPGFEDNDYEVEAGGDQLAPKRVLVQLGEPLPMDPNNVLLRTNGARHYQLLTITEEGMSSHWTQELTIDGWSSDFRRLKFHNRNGIGRIDMRGLITMDWTMPEELQQRVLTQYRPDLQEIAYIQNKDIFTLATEEGAEPVRWSQVGLYENILGWFDKDTLLINTESGRPQLVRRDGSNYQFLEWGLSTNELIFDSEGWIVFCYIIEDNWIFYQPEINEFKERFQVQWQSSFFGWSGDNKYYLIHSEVDEAGATSGIVAISQDGQLRQVAPQLLSPRRNLVAWDFAPSGSQMALSWRAEGQAGIYLVDAESQNTQLISDLVPNTLFWPMHTALLYVIEEGDQIGTWRLPLDGGEAQQLFAYRAENVTATPDGRLLLLANNTLWEYNGTDAPRILGEEGATQINSNSEFVWPQIEDATISAETAALDTTPTVVAGGEATPVALDTGATEATPTLAAFETATAIVLPSDATPTAVSEATLVPPLETPTVVVFDTATPVPPSETPTVVVFDTATPVPPSETPTAEPAPTEAVVVEAQEGIPARIDLRGFQSINVRDLDRSYAQVTYIDNTQTTFNAVARSPDGLWIYVSLQDGTTGWIASEYVVASQPLSLLPERIPVAAPQIGASITLSGYKLINVRSAPSLNASVVSEIYDPNARFVAVGLSQDTQWVLVRLPDGTLGWIAREFVIGDQSLDDLPRRFYVVN